MNKSKYLEGLTKECSKIRKIATKQALINAIIFIAISVTSYLAVVFLLKAKDEPGAFAFSALAGLSSFILLIKSLLLSRKMNDKVIIKCEEEIEKNLGPNETFETFDNDMINPMFGRHTVDSHNISVGHIFVSIERLTAKGPDFQILRGDNLGKFDVHYFSQNGIGTDMGIDIKDKNGKFMRSILTPNKGQFYKMLNALENIRDYANGEYIPMEQALGNEDTEFVKGLKSNISRQSRKSLTKLGIFGILFSIFLLIASVDSGKGFAYAGIILAIVSIILIIWANIKFRQK